MVWPTHRVANLAESCGQPIVRPPRQMEWPTYRVANLAESCGQFVSLTATFTTRVCMYVQDLLSRLPIHSCPSVLHSARSTEAWLLLSRASALATSPRSVSRSSSELVTPTSESICFASASHSSNRFSTSSSPRYEICETVRMQQCSQVSALLYFPRMASSKQHMDMSRAGQIVKCVDDGKLRKTGEAHLQLRSHGK